LDLFTSQMTMKLSVPRMLWMERYSFVVLNICQQLRLEKIQQMNLPMLILQVMLGRPLRISYALEKVRGTQVIVPRLSSVRKI
jgi:hypothetical protein